MGYNLAIEHLADPEKTWMLESFRQLDSRVLQPQHRALKEWLFLTVRPLLPPSLSPSPPPLSPHSRPLPSPFWPVLHAQLLFLLPPAPLQPPAESSTWC